jgi:formylglycine-generating enzyme required for sulfatase activity
MRSAASFFLLVLTAQTPALGQLRLPGMVQVDDSTYIDVKEVSVADWIVALFSGPIGRPINTVLPQLPYRYFFPPPHPDRTRAVWGKGRTGWTKLWIASDSLRTKQQRAKAEGHLDHPIVGITKEQAVRYCDLLREAFTSELEWTDTSERYQVVFTLPDEDLYDRLLGTRDSTNGRCALFNYACEPCQPRTDGREAYIHPGRELAPVYGYGPDWRGLYNLRGNAAEMTTTPGVAKGGSYAQPAKEALPGAVQLYEAPQPWIGFRCIARVRPR